MTKPQTLRIDDMVTIDPITSAQEEAWETWRRGDHMALYGTAGTGKTYLGMYLGLEEVLDKSTPQDKLVIVRSVVPTREVGYLQALLKRKCLRMCYRTYQYVQNYLKMVMHMKNFVLKTR